jgi:hypothetical protein
MSYVGRGDETGEAKMTLLPRDCLDAESWNRARDPPESKGPSEVPTGRDNSEQSSNQRRLLITRSTDGCGCSLGAVESDHSPPSTASHEPVLDAVCDAYQNLPSRLPSIRQEETIHGRGLRACERYHRMRVKSVTGWRAGIAMSRLGITLPLVVALLGAAVAQTGAPSLLDDGGFEASSRSWALPDGASVVGGGREGSRSLRVSNASPGYTFAQQSTLLDGRQYRRLTLSAWMRWSDVVRGRETWEGARMHLTFHDADGKQLGGWPDAGVFSASSDWRRVSAEFAVPRQAARVVAYLGLQNCAGAVWFDDVRMTAVDAQGRFAPRVTQSQTDTSRWLPFTPPRDEYRPSAIDMSHLLDAPAGKHGFIRVKRDPPAGGPYLEFEDGAPARFWGVNVVAGNCFPERAAAERVAARLARAGCNLVRFHHMDAEWASPNLFDARFNDTQHLSAASLERFDYFLAQLKKRGIYFFVDLAVHRKLKAGDGAPEWREVEAGLKIVGHFNPRLIELQKQFATQLMTHRNPHTGLRLVDDPAVVFQEVINESTLFWSRLDSIPASYMTELRGLFSRWLAERYSSRQTLAGAWRTDPQPLATAEVLANGSVRLAPGAELDRITGAAPTPRVRDSLRFLHDLQTRYFLEMRDHLRGLGARYLIAGSNHWTGHHAEIATQLPLDFIDRHSYWAHPEGGFGWRNVRFPISSALRQEALGPATLLSRQAVLGKPYTSSEWQYSWPNEYRLEGVPLVAAHAAMQGWDAAIQFDYAGGDWAATIDGNFDVGNKPDQWAQWPAMALLFHRGDVPTDSSPLTPPPVAESAISREAVGGRLPAGAETREGVRTDAGVRPLPTPTPPQPALGEKPLQRRPGLFLIETARTVAIVGFLAAGGKITVGPVTLESPTEFGSVIVSSLTAEPVTRSRNLLITTVGRAENSGMIYGPARDTVLEPGRAPILMDPVRGTLHLRRDGGPALRIYGLDGLGQRTEAIGARREGDLVVLPLNERRLTLWYEAVAE